MKIISIANGFQVDYMINYLNSISDKVDEIDFIASNIYPQKYMANNIRFINLRSDHKHNAKLINKFTRIFIYYIKLFKFLYHKQQNGIVHLQWLRFFIIDGILLPLYCKYRGYKIVYTVHDVVPHDKDNLINRFIFKIIYRIHWKLIAHTEFIKCRLKEEFNISENKVKVIKHGVYEINDNEIMDKHVAKKRIGIFKNEVLVMFFGVITQYKGLDLILNVFDKLKMNNIKLIVAGEVKDSYQNEINKLKSIYNKNIIYKLSYISNEELNLLFNAADLICLPYREASQSGVLFMSYAYGVPVLAPNLGGFPYDIDEGKTGVLFKPNDEVSLLATLKKALKMIASDNCFYNRNEIRNFAKQNYSWQNSGRELINFIKE